MISELLQAGMQSRRAARIAVVILAAGIFLLLVALIRVPPIWEWLAYSEIPGQLNGRWGLRAIQLEKRFPPLPGPGVIRRVYADGHLVVETEDARLSWLQIDNTIFFTNSAHKKLELIIDETQNAHLPNPTHRR